MTDADERRARFDLSDSKPLSCWLILIACTLTIAPLLGLARLPAAVLLGAMVSGIAVAASGGVVRIPRTALFFAQSVVGCLIGRSISPDTLHDIVKSWPLFVLMVLSVSVVSSLLGWLLAKTGTLPGSTAIWGTSPGAALVMTLMSEGYGADSRLVAFMQYLRVLMVTLAATLVTGIWGEPLPAKAVVAVAAGFDAWAFGETLAIIAVGASLGMLIRLPAGPILFPMVVGAVLNITGMVRIELPWWLLYAAYTVVGWGIGLRFTRQIVAHALGAFPKIAATLLVMIAICGGFAVFFGIAIGIDPLTAYLATSPGGMDSIAIIASSTGGNMSFVMAVQTTRFILVTATGPALATFIVKRSGMAERARDGRDG